MRMVRRTLVLLVGLLVASAATAEPLWSAGRTGWSIGVPSLADEVVQYAARELKDALDGCSGANIRLANSISPNRPTILVASMEDKVLKPYLSKLGLTASEDEQCVVKLFKSGFLVIAGNQPRATLHGVYAFLHDTVGVRWMWPGEDGVFYPKMKSFTLPAKLDRTYRPKIRYRGFHLCGDWYDVDNFRVWMARNCLNTHCHADFNKPTHLGFHATSGGHILAIYKRSVFEEHPEWFCFINGERRPSNLCFTNMECAEYVAEQIANHLSSLPTCLYYNMFAADNQEFCTCDRCKKNSISTNVFAFRNYVARILREKYPNQKLAGLAYSSYLAPPKCSLDCMDMLQFATHDRCNHHKLEDPDCPWNRQVIKYYQHWAALGVPIGEYNYEFDIYLDKGLAQFTPFFSVIEDEAKTARKYKHFLVIPEIPLSPKEGPPIEVGSVVNRLPICFYAQALWDENLTADQFLKDTAKTVWGPAEAEMYGYFTLLDQAWSGVKMHTLIIRNPMDVAASFLKPETLQKAHAFLNGAAAKIAAAQERTETYPTYDPERAKLALDREVELLKRWEGYVGVMRGERPRLTLPALSAGTTGPLTNGGGKLRDAKGEPTGYVVRCAWEPSANELIVYWDGLGKNRMVGATRLEATFTLPSSASRFTFIAGAEIKKQQLRVSETGVVDKKWKADWKVETDAKGTTMRIPLKLIASDLAAGKALDGTFAVYTKRDKPAEIVFPAPGASAILALSNLTEVDKIMLIWLGAPSRDNANRHRMVDAAAKFGWKAFVTDTEKDFANVLKEKPRLIYIRYPEKENPLSEKAWKAAKRGVQNAGMTLACTSLWPIPLDRCLDDPSMALKWANVENQDVGSRRFDEVKEGSWGETPYRVADALRNGGISACYAYFPVKPERWDILATQFNYTGKPSIPCIMMRRLGKGKILVFGLANALNDMALLSNIDALP